jgi:chromosome partitioning protein
MARIIAIANPKGGVGKTTATVSLAAALTERDRRVLAIDLDPQASLTLSLGFLLPDRLNRTIGDALDEHAVPLSSVVMSTREKFDLAPANRGLDRAAQALERGRVQVSAVRAAFDRLRDRYDFILIDCPANTGVLTCTALAVADQVVIPLTADYLTLESVKWFLSIIKNVREEVNSVLRIGGIFYNMYDPRTQHARDVMAEVQSLCDSETPLLTTTIRDCVEIKDASALGRSIIRHSPRSSGARAYRALAREIEAFQAQPREAPSLFTGAPVALAEKEPQAAKVAAAQVPPLGEPETKAGGLASPAPVAASATLSKPRPADLGEPWSEDKPVHFPGLPPPELFSPFPLQRLVLPLATILVMLLAILLRFRP